MAKIDLVWKASGRLTIFLKYVGKKDKCQLRAVSCDLSDAAKGSGSQYLYKKRGKVM